MHAVSINEETCSLNKFKYPCTFILELRIKRLVYSMDKEMHTADILTLILMLNEDIANYCEKLTNSFLRFNEDYL